MRARIRVGSGAVALPARPVLSEAQLARLGALGDERSAPVGEVLYRIGDPTYPFIAILEGEVAIIDAAGTEILRHGQAGFLGEMNLLTGQTVFVTAVVTEPLRYIAVEREALRALLFEDGPLSDLVLATLMQRREALQQVEGVGLEIVGPNSSEATMRMLDFARSNHIPYTWDNNSPPGEGELPLVRLPGGGELWGPAIGQVSRALGIGRELAPREEVDLVVVGGGPAGLGAAVYGASEGLETLVVEGTALGGQAGSSRRIENYLGFPAGITGSELTSRAVTQARKFNARTATPYRAVALEPGNGHHVVQLEEGHSIVARAVILATGAQYRRLPVDNLVGIRGAERVLRSRPSRGTDVRRLARRRRRRRQFSGPGRGLALARRRARDAAPPARRRARDDVRLPGSRDGPCGRRRSRPQRDRGAARRRRQAWHCSGQSNFASDPTKNRSLQTKDLPIQTTGAVRTTERVARSFRAQFLHCLDRLKWG